MDGNREWFMGYNELFSVARKVVILLISFMLPQSQANRAVSRPFQIVGMGGQKHKISPLIPRG